jgi:hypothetical protein
MPTTRSRRDLQRDRWSDPATAAYLVLMLVSQSLNLAGLLARRPTLQFAGMSLFVVAATVGVKLFARSIRNGWPYPDGISPADKLRAAREDEGIPSDPLAVVYRAWVVDFLRGLIGRRRFARRNRIQTWLVMLVLVAFWAMWESFGDVGVGGLHGFLTKLAVGAAGLCIVIVWIETADRLCARRTRLEAAHDETSVLTR